MFFVLFLICPSGPARKSARLIVHLRLETKTGHGPVGCNRAKAKVTNEGERGEAAPPEFSDMRYGTEGTYALKEGALIL